jgi:glutathione S-transferase
MKLYYAPGACSLAVHIVAREAGIPLGLVKVDLLKHRTESGVELATINPKNSVPAIELEDGQLLTEAAVLVQWLAEQAPGAGLIPPAGTMARFRVQEWLNFIATELHKGFGPLWHRDTPEATRESAIARLHSRFALLEERLGGSDYLAGDGFSVVDAYAFTIVSWSHLLKVDIEHYPRIQAYLDRIAARPAVRLAMTAEGLIRKAA